MRWEEEGESVDSADSESIRCWVTHTPEGKLFSKIISRA